MKAEIPAVIPASIVSAKAGLAAMFATICRVGAMPELRDGNVVFDVLCIDNIVGRDISHTKHYCIGIGIDLSTPMAYNNLR